MPENSEQKSAEVVRLPSGKLLRLDPAINYDTPQGFNYLKAFIAKNYPSDAKALGWGDVNVADDMFEQFGNELGVGWGNATAGVEGLINKVANEDSQDNFGGRKLAENLRQNYSLSAQRDAAIGNTNPLVEGWRSVVESAPSTAASVGVGIGTGLATANPLLGIAAAAGMEGAFSAGDSYSNINQSIRDQQNDPETTIRNSEQFKNALARAEKSGLRGMEADTAAFSEVAKEQGQTGSNLSGIANVAGSFIGGRVVDKLGGPVLDAALKGPGKRFLETSAGKGAAALVGKPAVSPVAKTLGAAAKTAPAEGLEEFLQSGAEMASQNFAMGQVDSRVGLMDNVPEAAVKGGLAGMIGGAGFGGGLGAYSAYQDNVDQKMLAGKKAQDDFRRDMTSTIEKNQAEELAYRGNAAYEARAREEEKIRKEEATPVQTGYENVQGSRYKPTGKPQDPAEVPRLGVDPTLNKPETFDYTPPFDADVGRARGDVRSAMANGQRATVKRSVKQGKKSVEVEVPAADVFDSIFEPDQKFASATENLRQAEAQYNRDRDAFNKLPNERRPAYQRHMADSRRQLAEATKAYRGEQAAAKARTQKKANEWNAIARKEGLPEVTFTQKPMTTAAAGPKGALVQTTKAQPQKTATSAALKQPTEDDLYVEDAELESELGRIGATILNKSTPLETKQALVERQAAIRNRRAEIETQLAGMADQSQALDLSQIANEDGSINREALNKNATVKEASTMFQKPETFEQEFAPQERAQQEAPQVAEARRLIEEPQLPVERTDGKTPLKEQQPREQKLTDDEIFEVVPASSAEKIDTFNQRAARDDGSNTGSVAGEYRVVKTKRGLHGTNIGKAGKTSFPTREAAEDWLADNANGRNVNLPPEALARKASRDKEAEQEKERKQQERDSRLNTAAKLAYDRVPREMEAKAVEAMKKAVERFGLKDRGLMVMTMDKVASYIRDYNKMNGRNSRADMEVADYDSTNYGAFITAGTKENPLTIIAVHKHLIHPNMKPDEMKAVIDRVMNHELVHALVRGGFITAPEYSTLLRLVRKRKMPDPKTGKPGALTYLDFTRSAYANSPAAVQEEEAIAELVAIEGFGSSRAPMGSESRGIVDKIVRVIKAMIGAFQDKDFRKFDDFISKVKSGEVARRIVGSMGIDPSNVVDPFGRNLNSNRADMRIGVPVQGPQSQILQIRKEMLDYAKSNGGVLPKGLSIGQIYGVPFIDVELKIQPQVSGKLTQYTHSLPEKANIQAKSGEISPGKTFRDINISTNGAKPVYLSELMDFTSIKRFSPEIYEKLSSVRVLRESSATSVMWTYAHENRRINEERVKIDGTKSDFIVLNSNPIITNLYPNEKFEKVLAHEVQHLVNVYAGMTSMPSLASVGSTNGFSLDNKTPNYSDADKRRKTSEIEKPGSMLSVIGSSNSNFASSYAMAKSFEAAKNSALELKTTMSGDLSEDYAKLEEAAREAKKVFWEGMFEEAERAGSASYENLVSDKNKGNAEPSLQAILSGVVNLRNIHEANVKKLNSHMSKVIDSLIGENEGAANFYSHVGQVLLTKEVFDTFRNFNGMLRDNVKAKDDGTQLFSEHILHAVANDLAKRFDTRHQYYLEEGEQTARAAEEDGADPEAGVMQRLDRAGQLSNPNMRPDQITPDQIDMAYPDMSSIKGSLDSAKAGAGIAMYDETAKKQTDKSEPTDQEIVREVTRSLSTNQKTFSSRADMRQSDQSDMSAIDGLNSGDVALLAKIMQDEPLLSIEQATGLLNEKKQSGRRPYRSNEVQGILNRLAKINDELMRPGTSPDAVLKYEKLWGTDKLKGILTEATNGTPDGVISKQFGIARSSLRAALNEMNVQPKDNSGGISPELAAKRLPMIVIEKADQMAGQGMGMKPLREGEEASGVAFDPEYSISSNGMLIRQRANSYVLQEMLRDSEDGGRGRTLGQILKSYRAAGYKGSNTAVINTFLDIEKKLRGNYDPDYYIGGNASRADMAALRSGVNKTDWLYKPVNVDEITEGKARANLSDLEYDVFDIVRNAPPEGVTSEQIAEEINKYRHVDRLLDTKTINLIAMRIKAKNLPFPDAEAQRAARTLKVIKLSAEGLKATAIARRLYADDIAEMMDKKGVTEQEAVKRFSNTVSSILSQERKKAFNAARADMKITAAAENVKAKMKTHREGILANATRYAQNQTGDAILDQLASLHRIFGRAMPNAEKFIFEQIDSSEGLERIMQKYRAAGGKVDAASMVALDNDANRGKTKPEIERVTTEAMEPVLNHINTLKVTEDMVTELGLISDVAARWFAAQKENGRDKDSDLAYNAAGLYLLAKHAPYREAFIRSKKKQTAELMGGEGALGIGIQLEEAGKIVEFLENKLGVAPMAELSKTVQKAVDKLTSIREAGGLIPRGLSSMQFYVPARGFAERDGEEDLNFVTINPGSRGRTPLRQDPYTKGRLSLPDDPLTSLAQMLQVAVMRKNTNETLNSLRRLVENNEGLFERPGGPGIFVAAVTYDRPMGVDLSRDPTWLRGRVIKSQEGQDLAPGEDSDIFYIKLSDEFMNISKYFMPSMHTKGNIENLLASANVIEPAMNFLRSMRTSKNPAFLPVNLVRDIGAGVFSIEMYAPGAQGEFLKRAPAVLRELMVSQIFRNEDLNSAGKKVWDDAQKKYVSAPESEYVALAREFIQNGGNQDLHVIDNYDSIANKVADKLKAINGGEDTVTDKAKKSIGVLSDFMEKANNAAELVSRVAAYSIIKERALAEGKSEAEAIKRAVYVGRNLTVNFNKHGTIGKGMNNLYMFWNASIGGTSQILRAFQSSPKVRAQLLSIAALGFAIPFIMRALMGDEWEKIPDWVKDRNFIIPTGGGNYFTVPLPYGYSWFITSGMNVSEAAYKAQNPLYGFGGAAQWLAIRNIDGVMNNFSPTGASEDLLTLAAPTLADPVLELAMNKDWTGRPIMPEPGMKDYDRESQRFWSNTAPLYTSLAGAMSSMTGGHNRIDGMIEISPNALEYIAEFVFGGLGKFVNQGTALATGKAEDISDIPILRSFAGSTTGEISVASDYATLQNRVKRVERSIDDAKKSSNYDMVADLERRYAFEVDLIRTFKNAERQIERQQSIRRAIEGKYRESDADRNEDDRQRLSDVKQKIKEIKSSAVSAVAGKR